MNTFYFTDEDGGNFQSSGQEFAFFSDENEEYEGTRAKSGAAKLYSTGFQMILYKCR